MYSKLASIRLHVSSAFLATFEYVCPKEIRKIARKTGWEMAE